MQQNTLTSGYSTIDKLLISKYGHTDISKIDFPDWQNKTVSVDKRGRDNGSILSYAEADKMVETFLNTPIP